MNWLARCTGLLWSGGWGRYAGPLAGCFMASAVAACTVDEPPTPTKAIRVAVDEVDGVALPAEESPLPPNVGTIQERWAFRAEMLTPEGKLDASFNGYARLKVVPGNVITVEGPAATGRNVRFSGGRAAGTAVVAGMFGASRLWVEDIGYEPAGPGEKPSCANGRDDDGDVLVDFPIDPGCAFADDMSEQSAPFATGVSPAVHYGLPTIADVQGRGASTPFPSVAVEISALRRHLIVTRVASSGFFVTDIAEPGGAYAHLFAFTFNAPSFLQVCHRVDFLSGTAAEFFGFTELAFPSYDTGRVSPVSGPRCRRGGNECDAVPGAFCELHDDALFGECQACLVPEPFELTGEVIRDRVEMERRESGLVFAQQMSIANHFAKGVPPQRDDGSFDYSRGTDCDLNQDGQVDFFNEREAACSNACSASPDCSEWTAFSSRGTYKVSRGEIMLLLNTGSIPAFDPPRHHGKTIGVVTGTLRHFSGGPLNWTLEARCSEDLVCNFDEACVAEQVPAFRACTTPPTADDNDAASQ